MIALKNLFKDLSAQFRRSGGLGARLACVIRYWTLYVRGRRRGLSQGDARLAALEAMSKDGESMRTVVMSLGDGLSAELDVSTGAFLMREILDDATYRAPGFVPQPGWTVVDVGAHQGLFTLDAARRVGPTGRVISVEPFPFNRALLTRNVAANKFDRVEIVPLAAAEGKGSKTLYVTPYSTGWQSLVLTGDGRVPMEIQADALDAILEARGAEKADLLKIDVEGAWRLVFAGAPKLLARRPMIVMEVEGDEKEVAAASARLVELGYSFERRDSVLLARPRAS